MLSPSECRLTLALLLFCRGKSSPIFPCTSLEIGADSAASLERSSKSPSSLFLALPENGHSPEIFSSFSFAQNIFPPTRCDLFAPFLSNSGGRQSWSSGSDVWQKFHHLVRASREAFASRNAPIQMISSKRHIQYSLEAAWANDGRELSLAKANEKVGGKEQ